MLSMLKRRSAVLVLLVATTAWGCDIAPTEPITTQDPVEIESTSENLLGGLLGTVSGLFRTTVRLVGTVVAVVGDVGEALIGPVGGLLEVADHDLVVPPGAVPHPATFRMEVLDGRMIGVELLATDPETGENVGEKGFTRPVQLALSYANADISRWNVDRLVIVRVHEDGTREVLPSRVDRESQQVTAELDPYSRCLGRGGDLDDLEEGGGGDAVEPGQPGAVVDDVRAGVHAQGPQGRHHGGRVA